MAHVAPRLYFICLCMGLTSDSSLMMESISRMQWSLYFHFEYRQWQPSDATAPFSLQPHTHPRNASVRMLSFCATVVLPGRAVLFVLKSAWLYYHLMNYSWYEWYEVIISIMPCMILVPTYFFRVTLQRRFVFMYCKTYFRQLKIQVNFEKQRLLVNVFQSGDAFLKSKFE